MHDRDRGRRRRWTATAVVVASIAAVVAVGPSLLNSDPSKGALAIQDHGSTFTITAQTIADAKTMQQELRAAGLNITIDTLPAAPSNQGTWLRAEFGASFPSAIGDRITEQIGTNRSSITVPTDTPGGLTLYLGRPPKGGERPVDTPVNALAEGPLHCLRLDTLSFEQADEALRNLGYDILWTEEFTTMVSRRGLPAETGGRQFDNAPESGTLRLISATFIAPDRIELAVTDPNDPLFAVMRWWGWPTQHQSEDATVRYADCPSS